MRFFPRTILALTVISLAGCGYTPLYQTLPGGIESASTQVQIGTVSMNNPERNVGTRRPAQHISERLRQSFPNTGKDMDTLKIDISETATELAIDTAATVERVSLTLTARVRLLTPAGRVLFNAILSSDAPYNVQNNPFSTEQGKVYARQVAGDNLADDISRRVALYYRQNPRHTTDLAPDSVTGPAAVAAPGGGNEERSNQSVDPSPAAPEQRFDPAPTL